MLAEEQKQETVSPATREMAIFVASVFSFLTFMCRILSFPAPACPILRPAFAIFTSILRGAAIGKWRFR